MATHSSILGASLMAQMVMQETQVQSLGQEDLLEKEWLPTPVFLPGEFHGQRSLVGYSPWGCKESDTAERLTLFLKSKHLAYSIPEGITSSCELRSPSLPTLLGGKKAIRGWLQ